MFPLEMKHIGKIEAVGTVQVFGYSAKRIDEYAQDMIYLNYAGPATAAASVWAMLIEKRALDFTDLTGKPHRLRHGGYPGLDGKEAPFKRFVTRIEHLAIDHYILIDKRFYEPDYDLDAGFTFVFAGDNMAERIGLHVSKVVDIAVFPEWYTRLAAIGQHESLVMPLINFAHPVYQISLDRSRWTMLISAAVERRELPWPGEESAAVEPVLTDSHTIPIEVATLQDDLARKIEASLVETGSTQPGCTLKYEGDWTWLRFDLKPDDSVLDALKQKGFRWGKARRAWYARSHIDEAVIQQLVGGVLSGGIDTSSPTVRRSSAPHVDIPVGGKKSPYFRSISHYSQKRAAKVLIAEALRAAGWTLHGWHEDRSDAMTDYYAPASWDGVATKDDWTVAVDAAYAAQHRSGTEGWPTFKATPGRANWHVEYRGEILAQGSGLARCCREYYEGGSTLSYRGADEPKQRPEQKAAAGFVEQIEALKAHYERS